MIRIKRLNIFEKFFLSVVILTISICIISYAEEQITITAYYPAPYGVYREMRADQISVGSTYRTSALSDGNLIVSNSVGIGTNTSAYRLHILGGDVVLDAPGYTNDVAGFAIKTSAGWGPWSRGYSINSPTETGFVTFGAYGNSTGNNATRAFIGSNLSNIWLTILASGGTNITGNVGVGTTNPRSTFEVGSSKTSNTCVSMCYGTGTGNTSCPPFTTIAMPTMDNTTPSLIANIDCGGVYVTGGYFLCCRRCTYPDDGRCGGTAENGICDEAC